MPYEIDPTAGFDEPWEPKDQFVLVAEGIYLCNIFAIERASNDSGKFYKLTLRINGGEFDGEDVKENFVGLYAKSIFRLYDILKAAGILETYYDAANKKWKALPTEEELQGKAMYVRVDHEPFQSKDSQTKELLYNADGSPKMLDGARPTRYYSAKEPKPDYTPKRSNPTPPPSAVPAGAAAVAAGGGVEVPAGYNAETPW